VSATELGPSNTRYAAVWARPGWGGLGAGSVLRRGKTKKEKVSSSFQSALRQRVRHRFHHPSLAVICLVGAAAFAPSGAFAACSPATGDNVTVTCSGATVDQGPGINTGYGDGTQNGLTINVQAGLPPASVTGTSVGIDVGSNNTINNFGVITTAGNDLYGINANGTNLTVINSGTIGRIDIPSNIFDLAGINASDGLSVTNNQGATIQGAAGIQGVGTGTVVNSGLISGLVGGGGEGINFAANNTSMVTVTNNATGVITGDVNGINANSAVVFNHGMISGIGLGSTGINANTLVLTNYADGTVTGDGFGVSGTQTANLTITNLGTISATGFGASVISGNVVNVTNFKTISTAAGNAGTAIFMSSGSVTNNTGGTIAGDLAIFASGNTSIFNAGTITGNGGAAITFSSGGNTLTLGPGSVINGTAHGFGADTFQLGGTGTDSFNASLFATQFSGYTTFNKIGTSTWTLTGTNATAMPWTISGGTLNVNGTLANSTMTVNSGGTLSGTGTVGTTTINNGGTFLPGNGTPGSSMTIAGNLAFQSGALYLVQLNPATSTSANVTGTASLNGGAGAAFLPGSYVAKQYTILTATGGVNGTFGSFNTLGIPSGFKASLSYDAHDVFLNLAIGFATPAGLNGNQQNVANALSNFFNSTGGIPAVFGTLTPAGLTQASGEVATGSQQTTFDAMNLFLGLLTDPFIAGRGDGATGGAGATPFAEEDDGASAYTANGKARSKSERDAYAAIYRKAPLAQTYNPHWSVWAAGFGGSQTTDGNATLGSNTVTSRVFGTAVGADYLFSPRTIAGFALAGGGTNFSLANALGTGRSDLFQAGAYVRHTVGPAYISAALAYGWQDITTDRTVTVAGFDRLRAEFNANAFSGRVEGGYRYLTPWMGVTPYAAGQFTTFDLPAYAEQVLAGANTFALAYGSRSVTDTRSELGFRTDKSYAMPNAVLTLRGRLAWAHDFNPDRNIAATFQTLPGASFVVGGAAQAHDSALTTASAEMKWLNGWSAAATFEGEFSNVTRSYAGKGVVRYAW
jgi:uncharacterized protein with beta-barrel porin domain